MTDIAWLVADSVSMHPEIKDVVFTYKHPCFKISYTPYVSPQEEGASRRINHSMSNTANAMTFYEYLVTHKSYTQKMFADFNGVLVRHASINNYTARVATFEAIDETSFVVYIR